MDERGSYEEQFGPVSRRIRRKLRAIRWDAKELLGLRRSILVEIRWRLGDEIMALPIYRALKQQYPDAEITLWCTYPELVSGNEHVHAVNADVNPDRYILLRDASRSVNRLEHYARLARVPAPAESPKIEAPEPQQDDWSVQPGRRVALAPGATWPTKQWETERWKVLTDQLTATGCEVVALGNAGEGFGAGIDRTGRTSVEDCARILGGADICVSSDSGLMHLSLAVGTPVVALFGPTNPAILVRSDAPLSVVTNERDCRFCWNDSQTMTEPGVCPRQIANCLGTIAVDTVFRQIQNVIPIRH